MNPGEALRLLREDPEEAFFNASCDFDESSVRSTVREIYGGIVNMELQPVGPRAEENTFVFRLSQSGEATDSVTPIYYFPTIGASDGGVGTCVVPADAPVGTIAVTGGMNGCSFWAIRSKDNHSFLFAHDYNGENLKKTDNGHNIFISRVNERGIVTGGVDDPTEENTACRIDLDSYYIDQDSPGYDDLIDMRLRDLGLEPPILRMPYFIPYIIKRESSWEVYYSGIELARGGKNDKGYRRIHGSVHGRDAYWVGSFG